jgi:hypothetical protein
MHPAENYQKTFMELLDDIHDAIRATRNPRIQPPYRTAFILRLPPYELASMGSDIAQLKVSLEGMKDYAMQNPTQFFRNALDHLEGIVATYRLMSVIWEKP